MRIGIRQNVTGALLAVSAISLLSACGGDGAETDVSNYTPTAAVGGTPITACSTDSFSYTGMKITSATIVPEGTMQATGTTGSLTVAMPEYCKITGTLNERVSSVDGKTYAISFDFRFPTKWNGRFFHQVNGGLDGVVTAAQGDILGGGEQSSGLTKGFAVLSSNAGHAAESGTIGGGLFGIDPQARLDYGYNAVASLTPMAKQLIKEFYGKNPDKSYVVGSSNGGRHTMVAASRLGDQYDGFLVSAPGFNLPKAAVAQLWGAQQYATISSNGSNGRPDITTSFSLADTKLVGDTIVEKCDALDGLADGMVFNWKSCQSTFDIMRDIPTCSGTPDGTCLTYGQKIVLDKVHAGAENSSGEKLYATFPWSEGISSPAWRTWKFSNSTGPRDPLSVAFVFMTPPVDPTVMDGTGTTILDFALNYNGLGFDIDVDAPKIYATNNTYTESAMSFMTPPDLTMSKMVANHGKMMIVHGSADPVFSVQDTTNWYESFLSHWGNSATDNARFFIVPGMGHSRGGPATDQYDMVDALVNWVEKGVAPDSVVAKARGAGSIAAGSVNTEVPATWSPGRTRPLCAYPKIAKYNGSGDSEDATNFTCSAS